MPSYRGRGGGGWINHFMAFLSSFLVVNGKGFTALVVGPLFRLSGIAFVVVGYQGKSESV